MVQTSAQGLFDQKLPDDGVVTLAFYEPEDAVELCEMDSDPEHRRRFEFPQDFIPSVSYSEKVIAGWTHAREIGERFAFAVRDLATRELLGGCELRPLDARVANLSYWTFPRHRSRGIASRAVALACQVAFSQLGLKCVEIVVDPDNHASRRVAIRN
ncbi:MAG: GNAT family N-acetyltransferase, partial [Acidobacteria bacterium]|nr:GNAT family N-acetyltransferase [Acidobacteriota bacterium]